MNTEKLRKGCTKGCLIYLGLSFYGFICAVIGWFLCTIFTGHSDSNDHDIVIEESINSVAADSLGTVDSDTTVFEITN